MTAWVFGGANGEFVRTLMKDIPYMGYGRDTIDYSSGVVDFTRHCDEVPELVVFNINACLHDPITDDSNVRLKDWQHLHQWIDGPYRWCVELIEWLFTQRANTRVLWITSMECASVGVSSPLDYAQPGCGKIFMYRVERAMEHQVIHSQNRLISNYLRNNIIMGVCVGSNTPAVADQINNIITRGLWKPTVIGLTNTEDPTSTECVYQTLQDSHVEYVSVPNDYESFIEQNG